MAAVLALGTPCLAADKTPAAKTPDVKVQDAKAPAVKTSDAKTPDAETPNVVTKNGLTIAYSAHPVGSDSDKIVEGQDIEIRFKVTDAVTGTPISDATPAAWIDARRHAGIGIGPTGGPADDSCKAKIGSFLQGGLAYRPDIDLNTWYILALNAKASISVIDPLLQYGGQRVVTIIILHSPGEDWVSSRARREVYVAMPATDEVAVVDTNNWSVASNIKVGDEPVRTVLQHDGRYLWVGHNGGVSVIDTKKRQVVKELATAPGRHDIVLSKDDRYAFVTNPSAGTVSMIEVAGLKPIASIDVNGSPGALAYSPLAKMVYVADSKTGLISAIDPATRKVAATMKAQPGLYALSFTQDGRWGFSANPQKNEVVVIDASTNQIVNRLDVPGNPDQVGIGAQYAYVRETTHDEVTMISIASLGEAGRPIMKRIPGGQNAPLAKTKDLPATAPVIMETPDNDAVLVANPSDKSIYYYVEGMNAPMGSYGNMNREVRAALAIDRSILETEPGVYTGHVRLPRGGTYDVAFLTTTPQVAHCFSITAETDPQRAARRAKPYHLQFLQDQRKFTVGDTATVQFQMTNPAAGKPIAGLKDIVVQAFQMPGVWRVQHTAKSLGNGLYQVSFKLPHVGVYYLNVESETLHARFNDLPEMNLRALPRKTAAKE